MIFKINCTQWLIIKKISFNIFFYKFTLFLFFEEEAAEREMWMSKGHLVIKRILIIIHNKIILMINDIYIIYKWT